MQVLALLVMQPTQLLQHLCMVRVMGEHAAIGVLGPFEFFLLFIDMSNLKPDVLLGKGFRRVADDVPEAL